MMNITPDGQNGFQADAILLLDNRNSLFLPRSAQIFCSFACNEHQNNAE